MKFKVKVGHDFDSSNEIKVDVSVEDNGLVLIIEKNSSKKKSNPFGFLKNWKILAASAIAALVFSTGAYAAFSGDHALFDKVIDALIQVASKAIGKK